MVASELPARCPARRQGYSRQRNVVALLLLQTGLRVATHIEHTQWRRDEEASTCGSGAASAGQQPRALLQVAAWERDEGVALGKDPDPVTTQDSVNAGSEEANAGSDEANAGSDEATAGSDEANAGDATLPASDSPSPGTDVNASAVAAPSATNTSGNRSCNPVCTWQCERLECERNCVPVCQPPSCETRCRSANTSGCSMQCGRPHCYTICPKIRPSEENSPLCTTHCSDPMCTLVCPQRQDCRSVCASPVCEYQCSTPTDCPEPKCSMRCDAPDHCHDHHTGLPPLDDDEIKVTSFDSPLNMAQEEPAPQTLLQKEGKVTYLQVRVQATSKRRTRTYVTSLPVVNMDIMAP